MRKLRHALVLAGLFFSCAWRTSSAACDVFTVSGYDPSVGPRTSTGRLTGTSAWQIAAVDPRIIPLGSTLRVWLDYGPPLELVAADTGGGVIGRWIDILMDTRASAIVFGIQKHGVCWS